MAFSWYPGACSTTYTHHEESIKLPTKSGPTRTLVGICNDVIPPCNLNPLLFNGHLQTAWTAVRSAGPAIHYKRRVFKQEDQDFKGHFTVDFVTSPPATSGEAKDGGPEDLGLREDPVGVGHHELPPRTTYFSDKEFESIGSEDSKPLLIALHGLSGGSYESYLRHVLEPMVKAAPGADKNTGEGLSGGEWEALVINSRGCAGSKITTSIMYNARATWAREH
jgi:predicted alpha/beta-fold hydrolase